MPYLIKNPNKASGKKRAHIWYPKDNDTVCRMYSTGGFRRLNQFKVVEDRGAVQICLMCQNVVGRSKKPKTGRVLWTETKIIET